MDSVEELRRKYDASQVLARDAIAVANEERNRLNAALVAAMEARLADRGIIPGAKVVERRARGSSNVVGVFTGVRSMSYGVQPHVAKMKNDGSAHATAGLYFIDENTIELAPGKKQ